MPNSYEQKLSGPPEVRPWHSLNEKRDGSPCVLARKFGYVRRHHRRVAEAEARLAKAKAEEKRRSRPRPKMIENLTRRVANRRAWLEFSTRTLEEHCRFAVARYNGELDAFLGRKAERRRGRTGGGGGRKKAAEIQKLVNYYLGILPTFKLAAAAAAGAWQDPAHADDGRYTRLPGHAESNDALVALMKQGRNVINYCKQTSAREQDDSEQLAWMAVLETAAAFDPTASNMAQFNTYLSWKARRRTQVRKDTDCRPGTMRIKGRIISRRSLELNDDDDSTNRPAMLHPEHYDEDISIKSAVSDALAALNDEEREIAVSYFMEKTSLRKLATERDTTVHKVRQLVAVVRKKLQGSLAAFAEA